MMWCIACVVFCSVAVCCVGNVLCCVHLHCIVIVIVVVIVFVIVFGKTHL